MNEPAYRKVKIAKLKKHPQNPQIHPESQIEKLEKSIEEFGFINPIIITEDNVILAGHARIEASERKGLLEAPAIVVPFEGKKADAYLIADNRLHEDSEWDRPLLKDLLEELDTGEFPIELTGFATDEIEKLMTEFHVEEEEEDEDEPNGGGELGVFVLVETPAVQEKVYSDLTRQGYECKVVEL